MCVAQLRGVEFGTGLSPDDIQPVTRLDREKAIVALGDVAEFFGFEDNNQGDADTKYLQTLEDGYTESLIKKLEE